MKKFMDESFMLNSKPAEELYEKYAKDMPIIDYHCHLSPQEICENKQFKNITEAWLYADHYKWRAMRAYGIEEKYITGDASDYEKFLAWAKAIPMMLGNPLYHWTHLELKRFFGVEETLNEKTAPAIWEKVNAALAKEEFRAKGLIRKSNVEVICTTDDPIDSLEYHIKLKEDKSFTTKVLPTFRPDRALDISNSNFAGWITALEKAYGKNVKEYDAMVQALKDRAIFFNSIGCRISDHGLNYFPYLEATKQEISDIFKKRIKGEEITLEEEEKYKTYTLRELGKIYSELGWAMQLHINVIRNSNTRMFKKIGPDAGYDTINDSKLAQKLYRFLDSLEINNSLPKTILYTLNPSDNYVLGTIMGSFQGEGIKGKMQLGAAWWFLDNKTGMIEQMRTLSNIGLLSCFVGMLTDSRSFLSYTRHEYFRRILCDFIGESADNGEFPYDIELLGQIVKDICYYNSKNYLGL